MQNISNQKKMLRQKMRQLRIENQILQQKKNKQLNRNIVQYIHKKHFRSQKVAFFWPLEFEADIRDSLHELYRQGYRILLPETPPVGLALQFHLWYPEVQLRPGRYKTLYPDTEIMHPQIIMLPLLAFDRKGNRLGYGGGYYDRTLAVYPLVKTAGIAFSYQEVSTVPVEKFDCSLQTIITETEIIHSQKD